MGWEGGKKGQPSWQMILIVVKCKVMHLGHPNNASTHTLHGGAAENELEKDLGLPLTSRPLVSEAL